MDLRNQPDMAFVHRDTNVSALNDVYCQTLDLRNQPDMAFVHRDTNVDWKTLKNCTVIEGDFSAAMITKPNATHEEFPEFKNLRVITGTLMIFQVSKLRSLKRMFPNLRIIGGQELILNYALVIYQNTHLVEVGLPKLTAIINGGVRIMDNQQLCYSRYIDWGQILIGPANDILTDRNKGTESNLCSDDCVPQNEARCHRLDQTLSCWDAETCQLECEHTWNPDKTVGPGCDDDGERCHEQCLGGCSAPDDPGSCHYCKNVIYQGICMEKCPADLYEVHHVYLVRRCVTAQECRNPTNSSRCIKCDGYCPVRCRGGTIDSFGQINHYLFKKCNVIEGYLEIELRAGLDAAAIEKVGEALGSIEVINGYLLIDFSTSFVSLHMFKRLRLIKGDILWRDRYALAIFENPNLRNVFNFKKQPLAIGNGTVLFHNNRMLCYGRIKALLDHMGLTDVKDTDVSFFSNGDRAICNEITFDVHTDYVHSYGFLISWYAYYVQTKLINHPGARNAISKIQFVKTLFSTPDPPKDVVGKSLPANPDRIDLKWDPPEHPNGEITHYTVKWQVFEDDASAIAGHVCDDKAAVKHHSDAELRELMKMQNSQQQQPTCPREKGCCDCEQVNVRHTYKIWRSIAFGFSFWVKSLPAEKIS
ncbi:unnamed protein product [Gongylonema pulchrum]|uniref:receptor protein-tyrosine kinase n=1 Tax=Gongylonema pulchrum TaxID=637853 RepID=A0A3P7MXD2_9BILA|nr:unnamed protein product [Gongylonema pulchrum]